METEFKKFYKSLDKSVFKYFTAPDGSWVYEGDAKLVPAAMLSKDGCRGGAVKLVNPDETAREMLVGRGIPVEEYEVVPGGCPRLVRSGHPMSYGAFADACIGESTEPTVCAVRVLGDEVEYAYVAGGRIRLTKFKDDDLLSGLYSLVSAHNCLEMLCSDKRVERAARGWGLAVSALAECGPEAGLKRLVRRDLPVEAFERAETCLVNIRDFDLADFGCITAQGRRLLDGWLRAPSVSLGEINRRLDLSEALAETELCLGGCTDLHKITARIQCGRVSLSECLRVCQMAQLAPAFAATLKARGSAILDSAFVQPLENIAVALRPLLAEVEAKICLESGRMRSGLSPELRRLEAEKKAVCDEIEAEFRAVKALYPRVKYQAKTFRLPRGDYSPGDFEKRGYVVHSLLKTGVSFLTAGLAGRKEALGRVEAEIEQEETRLFEDIKKHLLAHSASLEILNFIIALLDVHLAFSRKCHLPAYSRPVFAGDSSAYEVRGFFHPLLENRDPVLNSIAFPSGDAPGRVCILTGPNMGGKSTVLKALSTISLYAQIGCYVPATHAVLPIFDKIFMRVGAKDYSALGQSTFMVEMLDLARIATRATKNSLILIDELGRGTSALDGLALVLAAKEHLSTLGAYAVVATHFSELASPTTFNLTMEAHNSMLTYRLREGVADESFGINAAKTAGLPEDVLQAINEYLEQ